MRLHKPHARGQEGIALIVALLSLMVLTFLGLTLAATTSTELQIATNYRRSQQALYNAEAGIEAAKVILQSVSWSAILPVTRHGTTWNPADETTLPAAPAKPGGVPDHPRNWENADCDYRGGRVGYGLVLSDTTGPLAYRTDILGTALNGAVTLWVRRDVVILATGSNAGLSTDDANDSALVLTAEGVAPYTTGTMATGFGQSNAATRTLEVVLSRSDMSTNFCESYGGQSGGGHSSASFAKCSTISGGSTALAAFTDACRGDANSPSAQFGSGGAGSLGQRSNR